MTSVPSNGSWASDSPARSRPGFAGTSQAGDYSLPDSQALLFCDHREDRDHRVAKHSTGIKVRLGEGSEPHPGVIELLQIRVGFIYSFPAKRSNAQKSRTSNFL